MMGITTKKCIIWVLVVLLAASTFMVYTVGSDSAVYVYADEDDDEGGYADEDEDYDDEDDDEDEDEDKDEGYDNDEDSNSITIILKPSGGTVSKNNIILYLDGDDVKLPTPKRNAWTFLGWYTKRNKSYDLVSSSVSYDDFDESTTIYALWKKRVNIVYDANKGKVSQKGKKVWYSEIPKAEHYGKLPTPSRSGYIFKGWYTKKTGGFKVTSGTDVRSSSKHSIYAHWKKKRK